MARQLDKRDFGYDGGPRGGRRRWWAWGHRGDAGSGSVHRVDPQDWRSTRPASASSRHGSRRWSWRAKPRHRHGLHRIRTRRIRAATGRHHDLGGRRDRAPAAAAQRHPGVPKRPDRAFPARRAGAVTGAAVEAAQRGRKRSGLDARSAVIEAAKYVAQGDDEESTAETDGFGGPRRGHDRTTRRVPAGSNGDLRSAGPADDVRCRTVRRAHQGLTRLPLYGTRSSAHLAGRAGVPRCGRRLCGARRSR